MPTACSALASLADCFERLAGSLAEQQDAEGLALLAQALLQLACVALQLPAQHAAAAATLGTALLAGPRFGSKLPALLPVASASVAAPAALLRVLPQLRVSSLAQLQAVAEHSLEENESRQAMAGLAEEMSYLSSPEVSEGAALAVCAAVLATADGSLRSAGRLDGLLLQLAWPEDQASGSSQADSQHLLLHLAPAVLLLLDLAAQQQSVPLTLVPLVSLWAASQHLRKSKQLLPACPPAVRMLLDSLVTVMSHNPLELVRSCTHEALHAALDCLQPAARLEAVHVLLEVRRLVRLLFFALHVAVAQATCSWLSSSCAGPVQAISTSSLGPGITRVTSSAPVLPVDVML